MSTRRAALYARLSISSEESVSIERQLEAGRTYAAARGWTVVGEFYDDGVSASKNKPEERKGWRALMAADEKYDAVVVWKVDRLARRVLDFLHADEALQERKAGIVAVDDPIDMTTAQGRAFATMLAVFAELEAANISARVAAARSHLLRSGRVVGGTVPYGWRSVPNPDGPGFVLRRDPDRIEWVRGMVERCQRGESIYKIKRWLDTEGAPLPSTSQANRVVEDWRYTTVERLLRHPILAGMTPFNPGNAKAQRGDGVLRDERGLAVVDQKEVAIMAPEDWRAMVAALDSRNSAQSKPRAMKTETSALLSGLVYCGRSDKHKGSTPRMYRGTTQGRHGYYCKECHQVISNFEDVLVEEFLHQKGDWMRWSQITEVYEGGGDELPDVEHAISQLDDEIRTASSREDRERLRAKQEGLYDLRDDLREQPGQVVERWNEEDATYGQLWAMADDVEERRAVLEDALERVVVKQGRPGRRKAGDVLERLQITWKRPDELGQREDHDAV